MKTIAIAIIVGLCSIITIQAQILVEGKITDENNEPLIGVTIIEKGTTNGTTTDLDGLYSITVADNAILIFSYVGYESQEIKATSALNVQLTQAYSLDEVVVMSCYQISNYDSPIIDRIKSRRNIKEMLQGKAAGIQISNGSGQPGAATNIIIRGTSTNFEGNVYQEIKENSFLSVAEEPLSTFSIDVDRASYSNIRAHIENGSLPPSDAVRVEEMINYFKYNYPQPEVGNPLKIISETATCPWEPEHRLMMVALQGKEYPYEELPPSNLVFLLDVSGSMASANKLPLLQQSFRFLVDQLRPEDKVSIVVYAGSSGVVLPATSGDSKIKIQKAINNLYAGGSTAGGEGIELAYQIAEKNFIKDGNNRVILATDGDFNVGISSDAELVKLIEQKRETGVFLTVLGVGSGNYMDGKMQQLAQAGNGNHMYIDNIKEAQKIFTTEFGATNFTIAKDVKFQIEFNPQNVAAYRLIGYENRLLENEDFIDDTKDAGEVGSGHTVTAIYEVIPVRAKSTFAPKEIPLKYSDKKVTLVESLNQEIATIKLRYKQPDEHKSHEMVEVIENNESISKNENFLWASLVAEFGMYLSESDYLPKNYNVKALVDKAQVILKGLDKPTDEHKGMIDLIKEVNKLKETSMIE